ncbi:MAG: hypothetical protein AAFU64_04790, partial [Bacteroidota bacterium]
GKGTTFYFDLPQALPESASEDKGLDLLPGDMPTPALNIIRPFIPELKSLEVEENSAIEKVLAQIPEKTAWIQQWKRALRESLDDLDQDRYLELIQL